MIVFPIDNANSKRESRGVVALSIEPMISQCMKWTYKAIRFNKIHHKSFALDDMYKYLSVSLFSMFCGFGVENSVYLMIMIGLSGIKRSDIKFIYNNCHCYRPLKGGNCCNSTWNALIKFHQFGDIERLCFSVVGFSLGQHICFQS